MTDWSHLDALVASLLRPKGETLSETEVGQLGTLLGAPLPADYVRFITHHGGGYCNAHYGVGADGFGPQIDDFMGRSTLRYESTEGETRWRFCGDPEPDDLTIAGDLMGQQFLLSASTGRVRWLDHETRESVPLTETFTELLERMQPVVHDLYWLDEYGLPKLAEPAGLEEEIEQLAMLGSGSLHQDFGWFLNNIELPTKVDLLIKPLDGVSFHLTALRAVRGVRDGLPEMAHPHEVVAGDDNDGNPLLYSVESGNLRLWNRTTEQSMFVAHTFGQLFQLIASGNPEQSHGE